MKKGGNQTTSTSKPDNRDGSHLLKMCTRSTLMLPLELLQVRAGEFLEGSCGNLSRVATPFQAEALATLHSLERISQLGMSRIILETDVSDLVRGLTSSDLDQIVDGSLLK